MTPLRVAGLVLVALGTVWAAFPDWFGPLTRSVEPDASTFDLIERRIRGGMLLGLGLALVARTELRPWGDTIATGVFYIVLGALLARVLGLMLEGSDPKQWMLVVVEAVLMAIAAAWLWRSASVG